MARSASSGSSRTAPRSSPSWRDGWPGMGGELSFCYEAGPCGYGLQRQLSGLGHDCVVVAPSLIPMQAGRPGEDRSARCADAGEAASGRRADARSGCRTRRTRRCAIWSGRGPRRCGCSARRASICRASCCGMAGSMPAGTAWTLAYRRWLTTLRFEHPAQQIVLQDYIHAVAGCRARGSRDWPSRSTELLPSWSLAPVVEALQAMRGVGLIVAVTVVGRGRRLQPLRQSAPADGLSRPGAERALERQHGPPRRDHQGRQRLGPAGADRGCLDLPHAGSGQPQAARPHRAAAAAPSATSPGRRSCGCAARYRRLVAAGKAKVVVTTAIAREMVGFIWAIARQVQLQPTRLIGRPHTRCPERAAGQGWGTLVRLL